MRFKKVALPYALDALEPYIDKETVDVHYNMHHTTYMNNFNKAFDTVTIEDFKEIRDVMLHFDYLPEAKRNVARRAGGGLWNHDFYWTQFIVDRELNENEKKHLEGIINQYGSKEAFIEAFVTKATSLFGSGWTWLVKVDGTYKIMNTHNQDNPLMEGIETIIIGIDVWEHAYYLKYKQDRKAYVENVLKLTLVK